MSLTGTVEKRKKKGGKIVVETCD